MQFGIVHLKTKGRKPVRMGPVIYIRDVQQDIPTGWCTACRRELYDPARDLCRRCERMIDDE